MVKLVKHGPMKSQARVNWLALFLNVCFAIGMNVVAAEPSPVVLVIHGGAGISRDALTPEREVLCRKTMEEALRAGGKVLRDGGPSLDAVEAAIVVLEDSPLFNAGRGSA